MPSGPGPFAPSEAPPKTVLIVEDEPLIRFALADFLHDNGLNTIDAGSADEALILLGTEGDWSIDVVVTDVHMGGSLDGRALAAWIKLNRLGLPVIIVSGHVQESLLKQGQLDGCPYFSKPYVQQLMLSKIRQMLGP